MKKEGRKPIRNKRRREEREVWNIGSNRPGHPTRLQPIFWRISIVVSVRFLMSWSYPTPPPESPMSFLTFLSKPDWVWPQFYDEPHRWVRRTPDGDLSILQAPVTITTHSTSLNLRNNAQTRLGELGFELRTNQGTPISRVSGWSRQNSGVSRWNWTSAQVWKLSLLTCSTRL